jgi:hypothetical protein
VRRLTLKGKDFSVLSEMSPDRKRCGDIELSAKQGLFCRRARCATAGSAFPPDRPVAASVAPDLAHRASCDAAARSRANDAAVQDFDDSVQQAVYQGTYADCLKWAARH